MPARDDKNYHVVLHRFLGFIFPDILKMPHKIQFGKYTYLPFTDNENYV